MLLLLPYFTPSLPLLVPIFMLGAYDGSRNFQESIPSETLDKKFKIRIRIGKFNRNPWTRPVDFGDGEGLNPRVQPRHADANPLQVRYIGTRGKV